MFSPAARVVCCALLFVAPFATAADPDAGRELFVRQWLPDDPRSVAGDGLGPVFNDTSCVACHNQGGVGGAGPPSKNAQIASVFSASATFTSVSLSFGSTGPKIEAGKAGKKTASATRSEREAAKARVAREREQLEKLHPGFLTARSVVVQRFSVDPDYADFHNKLTLDGLTQDFEKFSVGMRRSSDKDDLPKLAAGQSALFNQVLREARLNGFTRLLGQRKVGDVVVLVNERNTPPLFGSGIIDAIPDSVLLAAAKKKHAGYPEVSGRVARLKGDKLGRFGWKSQQTNLRGFVLNACAVELGLEVPGHAQAIAPHKPDYVAPGLDMTEEQCNELVSFVEHLPQPRQQLPADAKAAAYLAGGRKLFDSTGCAACHTPDLGEASGIYSDLLLHDMGPGLSDVGAYGSIAPNATEEEELKQPLPPLVTIDPKAKPLKPADETKLIGAMRQEWRTPPLWGLRDSAPYFHDGRAATAEQAIALHDGEAKRSTRQYFRLSAAERLQLTAFLNSLASP